MTPDDEGLLIKKIREGDGDAFKAAFLKYYSPMCNYIWKYVRTDDLAEEIVQEVFATIWENRIDLDPDGHLRGLLYEAARNKALDYIRHQKIIAQYLEQARINRQMSYTPVHHHDVDHQAFMHDIETAINDLPPKARRVFKLNREEGLTYKEIAEHLDISLKTVESQMRRVLQKLRSSLSKYLPILMLVSLLPGV